MIRHLIIIAIASNFIISGSQASFAAPLNEPYDPYPNLAHPTKISAGFYLRIPFGGRPQRSSNRQARFGFAVKANIPNNYSPSNSYQHYFQATKRQQIQLLDLSIGSSGLKSFKINNFSFHNIKKLNAGETGEKRNDWPWVVLGALVVGGIVAIVTVSQDIDGLPLNQN